MDFKILLGGRGLACSGLGQEEMSGCWEHVNELLCGTHEPTERLLATEGLCSMKYTYLFGCL